MKDGKIVPPPRVVRHDGDDPYLVVAADKGTATFSDIANEHLRPRTASGWAMPSPPADRSATTTRAWRITARGAWECVKRHFREMDIDIQTQPFRVVGVGDMSGDVFGNGMLLSHAHPARRRLRSPRHLHRSRSRDAERVSPSASACSICRARAGRTTTRPRSPRAAASSRARPNRLPSATRCSALLGLDAAERHARPS